MDEAPEGDFTARAVGESIFTEADTKRLGAFGDVVTRRKGSHLRLTTQVGGGHHVTVRNHDALRVGTLNGILQDVAEHAELTRDAVVERLLG